MWLRIAGLALAASLLPLTACAQASSQDAGPSSDMRAKMDAVRADARTGALAALADDHRTKVQAIVDAFDADGSTLTVTDASSQIDAVLTPAEATALLTQQQKMRDAMRAAMAGMSQGGGRHGGFGGGANRVPDAGRFVLQVDATPQRFREAMRADRGNG